MPLWEGDVNSKRFLGIAWKVALVVVLLAAVSAGCGGSAVKVTTARVGPREISEQVMVAGNLNASQPQQVIPQVYGSVAEVYATDGQEVAAGQPLVQLDTANLEQALLSAQASLESTESIAGMMNSMASIPASIGSAFDSMMTSVDAGVQGLFDLEKSLIPVLPEEQRMAALQAINTAESDYNTARAQNAPVVAGGGGGMSTGAQEAAASKAIENAMKNLQAATITAPISGTLVASTTGGMSMESLLGTMMSSFSGMIPSGLNLSALTGMSSSLGSMGMPTGGALVPGSFIMSGTAIYSIVDLKNMTMVAKVDETDIAKMKEGLTAAVALEAYPGKKFAGKVIKVADTSTTNEAGATAFEVVIQMDLSDIDLKIGMTGTADVTVATKQDATVVPVEALVDKKGKKYVFKVVDGKAVLTPVVTGLVTETEVEVLEGVKNGDRVVTKDVEKLKDGQGVKI